MKRLETPLLATILLLLTVSPAFGQVSLAATGGVNIASMDISTDDDFVLDLQSVTRLSIGLAANIPASESWGLQLGGSYSQKGGRFLLDRLREVVRSAPYLAAHLAVYRYAIYHER